MYRTTSREDFGNANQSLPALPLGVWSPFLAGALRWKVRTQEVFTSVIGEWQNFAGRRLEEDFTFMQKLMRSRTPDQVLGAHADFWRKAADDYGKEIRTIADFW